jgi:septum site-determining protein MinD
LPVRQKKAEEYNTSVDAALLITRYLPKRVIKGEMLSIEDIKDILCIPLIGVIPESRLILQASNAGVPVTAYQNSIAGQAYIDAIDRFLGKEIELRFVKPKKRNFIRRIFGV